MKTTCLISRRKKSMKNLQLRKNEEEEEVEEEAEEEVKEEVEEEEESKTQISRDRT